MEVQVERANITDEERNKIFQRVRKLAGILVMEIYEKEVAQKEIEQQTARVDE